LRQPIFNASLFWVFSYSLRVCCIFVLFSLMVATVWAETAIDIKGVNSALEENLRAHMGDIDDAEFKNPRLLERRLNGLITESTHALGYYHSEWIISLRSKNVLIELTPGPPVILLEPEIKVISMADDQPVFTKIIESNDLVAGQQLDHSKYDALKKQLMQQAKRFGFFDAVYQTSELLVDVSDNTAKIKLILESGERYYFGAVTFEGSQLSNEFMARIPSFKEGDAFDALVLANFRRDLYATGYFSQVTVSTEQRVVGAERRVNLHVKMEDTSQHHFEVGFGLDTDTGPRVRLNWDMPLVGEKGHAWRSKLEVSEPIQEVSGTYRIPLEQPLVHFLLFDTGYTRQKIESTESSLVEMGVSRLNLKENNWQHRYGVNVDFEKYRQGSDNWSEVYYLVPSVSWMKSEFDKGGDPSHGYRLWLAFEGSTILLGSDANFFKAHFGARWLTPLWQSTVRMLTRIELGAIDTSDILQLPVSRRFYTGGDQTIRGYEYNSVATRDDEGELVGGRYLNVASLEFSERITDRWRGAIFADTGRAYNQLDEAFSSSVGFGVRWLSVIGEVRVDLAHPLDNQKETPVRLHLSMGPPL
jgi:translocation and assembly module TamA